MQLCKILVRSRCNFQDQVWQHIPFVEILKNVLLQILIAVDKKLKKLGIYASLAYLDFWNPSMSRGGNNVMSSDD